MDLSRINTWKPKQLKTFLMSKDRFNLDIHGHSAMYYAISDNNVRLVCELLKMGALDNIDESEFPLHMAASLSDTKITKILLFCGIDETLLDTDGYNALYHAVELGNIQMIKVLVKKNKRTMFHGKTGWKTPFYKAVLDNNVEIVEFFISETYRIDLAILYSCIHETIKSSNVKVLRLLMDYMSKNNDDYIFIPDIDLAVNKKDMVVLKALFDYNVNIYSVDLANMLDDLAIAKLFIEKHANYKMDCNNTKNIGKMKQLDELISQNKELEKIYLTL
ncbi:ankyrin-repeat protein-NFkB inhibitor [Murmansk poxvirus]|uniref:Ankyrin-repeat protein-NFkB inhibitor n=1 Tax=Murmansk poxvirus TaxID=2025359 RepID=A0A223FML2_9POXV|nr:ankyrin-repeat protein-NFkB inhibitor [Murmansk poxvirus]AST09224.1 ankyrin-repeat protein-NFkB inhibitor [Murmansk poxvirus]